MYFDTFDSGFGMMPGFDSGFGTPMFNGSGCFPTPSFDMGFNGMPMGLPMTCGYSPTPFGCNSVSMDFNGNVCLDGIPYTSSTPPAWMTARAAQAQMHINQLDMQMADPNFWMNFLPQSAFNPATFDWTAGWHEWTLNHPLPPLGTDMGMDMNMDFNPGMGMDFNPGMDMGMGFNPGMDMGFNPDMGMDMGGFQPNNEEFTPTYNGEEVLPCGLTQSEYDRSLDKYKKMLDDCDNLLEHCGPYQMTSRAMIQNNIRRIQRDIQDLDKPFGRL